MALAMVFTSADPGPTFKPPGKRMDLLNGKLVTQESCDRSMRRHWSLRGCLYYKGIVFTAEWPHFAVLELLPVYMPRQAGNVVLLYPVHVHEPQVFPNSTELVAHQRILT